MSRNFKKHKKTLLSVLVSFVLVGCLMLANYISSLIIPADNNTESITQNAFTLHFLTLGKSQVENEAISHAPDYRTIGAGGVVWQKDDYYYIVSSAYANKNDAELVKSNLLQTQNIESEIISYTFDSITINGNFSAEQKKIISKALSWAQSFYNSIYDIAISLDTGVYNEISAKLAVNSVHNTLATIYADFSTLYQPPLDEPLNNIYTLLKSSSQISQQLCTGQRVSEGQTYSSLLKYRYLEVLSLYDEFTKSI